MRINLVPNRKRVITRFLLFPKIIGTEKRWLEVVHIEQQYVFTGTADIWKWVSLKWL